MGNVPFPPRRPWQLGNIDMNNRPVVHNPDGTISTVRSMSFGTDQGEVLVPTLSPTGQQLTPQQSVGRFRDTGQHLGIFPTPDMASLFAQYLSRNQGRNH